MLAALTVSIIPFLVLMILNCLIYRVIKRKTMLVSTASSRTKREIYIATILILIVVLFGICHSLQGFLNIVELSAILIGLFYIVGRFV